MPAATEGIVKSPPPDIPALGDSTTAILFNLQTRRLQGAKISLVALPLILTGAALAIIGHVSWNVTIAIGLSVVVPVQAVYLLVRFRRAVSNAKPLLATQAWRPVPAQVSDDAVWIQIGEERLRVRPVGMPSLAEMVVEWTGRVWIVGPDSQGWLALRVDGSHAAWPARGTPEGAPKARPRQSFAEQITESCARVAAGSMYLRLAGGVLLAAFAGGFIALEAWLTRDAVLVAVLVPIAIALWLLYMMSIARDRDDLALPRLIRAGLWQRAEIQLQPWKVHRSSPTCSAEGTIRLADGLTCEITLRRVGLDVYANAWETGTIWVAGEPVPGSKLAVGFPGYPALGVALVS